MTGTGRGEEGRQGEGRKAGDFRRTWDLTWQNSSHRARSGNFAKFEPPRAFWELSNFRAPAGAPGIVQNPNHRAGTLQIASLRVRSRNLAQKFGPPRALRELCKFRANECAPGPLQISSHRVRSRNLANCEHSRALQEPCKLRAIACAPEKLQKFEPSRALRELCKTRATECAPGTLQISSHRVRSRNFANCKHSRALQDFCNRDPPRALRELCKFRATECAPGTLQISSHRVRSGNFAKS